MQKKIALRIDDICASSKLYEIYGREGIFFSNFLFLKYTYGLRKRFPYREIKRDEWKRILEIFTRYGAKLTVGITASWVEKDGSQTPFFEKFPQEAAAIKEGLAAGIIEVANHGLTHCVVGKHLPKAFSSNRTFHREFWDWIPAPVHQQHIQESQRLLTQYFGRTIETLIPPGNVWTGDTERYAYEAGIKYLSSREELCPTGKKRNGLLYIGEKHVIAFHDRDIVLNGISWLEDLLSKNQDKEIVTVSEFGITLGN